MHEICTNQFIQTFLSNLLYDERGSILKSGINVLSLKFSPIFAWFNSAEFQDKTADSIVKYQKLVK